MCRGSGFFKKYVAEGEKSQLLSSFKVSVTYCSYINYSDQESCLYIAQHTSWFRNDCGRSTQNSPSCVVFPLKPKMSCNLPKNTFRSMKESSDLKQKPQYSRQRWGSSFCTSGQSRQIVMLGNIGICVKSWHHCATLLCLYVLTDCRNGSL